MRFDVYANENQLTRKKVPFLLVLQSGLLDGLDTTVVAPLGKPSVVAGKLVQMLTPLLDVEGVGYVMYTPELAAIPNARLRKRIANIESQRDTIVRALDFLFDGI
ncbi:MAG TPA: CcdB family protein [Rudaea sp.]|jgi:toxin CcdB|uniref:CcdB family protein n=1 Tax=Rudaea sp. TaxID=2136325 RepID=UPI002F938FEB